MNAPRKPRGPSYPSFALPKALEYTARIEANHRHAEVHREDTMVSMGFSGRSGASLQAIATLSSYGLLETPKKGYVAVSERARAILFAGSEAERSTAMKEAAVSPPLFQDLHEKFPGFDPPDAGIIASLRRMGLVESTARKVCKAYRDTIACIANAGDGDRSASPFPSGPKPGHDSVTVAEKEARAASRASATEDDMHLNPVEFSEWMRIPVGTATVRILTNAPIGKAEYTAMMQTLEIQGSIIGGGPAAEPEPAAPNPDTEAA